MPWTNYHSHTKYCDGSSEPEDYIAQAIHQNLNAYGFSSHAPVPFKTDWCIPDKLFSNYLKEITSIKEKYKSEIDVYLGLEIDYIPNISGRNRHILKDIPLDYYIGSIHFVDKFSDGTHWGIDTSLELFTKGFHKIFNADFKKTATRFYELTWQMLQDDKPDIIGHLDKIKMYNNQLKFFVGKEKWYVDLIDKTIFEIATNNTIVEINTRGFYKYGQNDLYPSDWIIHKLIAKGIPIMLNSDSHKPEEITSGFEYTANELQKMGLDKLWILLDNKWQERSFNQKGYI